MPIQTVNIAPALFRVGSLLSVSFGGWTGMATAEEKHKPLLGLENVDARYVKSGTLILAPPTSLRPFEQIKKKTSDYIIDHSRTFPIPHARMVHNDEIEKIDTKLEEFKDKYLAAREKYVHETYAVERPERIEQLKIRYPAFAAHVEGYFPTAAALLNRFGMKWLFFQVQDLEAYNEIMAEKQAEFRHTMNSFVNEMATEFRTAAVRAALAFQSGLERAKDKVDSRVVKGFKDFLDRFQQQDFLGDVQMKELLESMKSQVYAVEKWETHGDKDAIAEIKQHLARVVELGQAEGEAVAVANNFVRSIGEGIETAEVAADQFMSTNLERGGEISPSTISTEMAVTDQERSVASHQTVPNEIEELVPV